MEFTSNNLTFVIVTFNSRKVIYDCLNSLPKDFNKLIVENSSDEELKKELERNYDKTEVILSRNIGMGAANNIGILKSNTQYVYVLNPDVILKKDTLFNINYELNKYGTSIKIFKGDPIDVFRKIILDNEINSIYFKTQILEEVAVKRVYE